MTRTPLEETSSMIGNQVYGPFPDWEAVPTPHGTWGVPAGHRMWLEMVEVWDPKEQRKVNQPWPVMELVEDFKLETDPLPHSMYRKTPVPVAVQNVGSDQTAEALTKIADVLAKMQSTDEGADADA